MNVPLSASQSVCEGIRFNLSPPWNQEGELTTMEADRPRRWKDLDLDGIREDTASTSSIATPTPTPRSGGCETMCPPGHYAKLPVTRSWKHSKTLKSRSRCNLTKGAHFVNWLNTCQNVFVQHGSCCFTNKCNQGKGYFIFAICKCIATCFKFPASLKLANCWLLSKKPYEGLSSSLQPISLFPKIISVYFINTFIKWHCGCGSVADHCVFPVKEDICDG